MHVHKSARTSLRAQVEEPCISGILDPESVQTLTRSPTYCSLEETLKDRKALLGGESYQCPDTRNATTLLPLALAHTQKYLGTNTC